MALICLAATAEHIQMPKPLCRQIHSYPCTELNTTISIRRFNARLAAVSFGAIGSLSPTPSAERRSAGIWVSSECITVSARAWESAWFDGNRLVRTGTLLKEGHTLSQLLYSPHLSAGSAEIAESLAEISEKRVSLAIA